MAATVAIKLPKLAVFLYVSHHSRKDISYRVTNKFSVSLANVPLSKLRAWDSGGVEFSGLNASSLHGA